MRKISIFVILILMVSLMGCRDENPDNDVVALDDTVTLSEEVFEIYDMTHSEISEKYGEPTEMGFWLGAPYAYYNDGVMCYYEFDAAEVELKEVQVNTIDGEETVFETGVTVIEAQAKPIGRISLKPNLLIKGNVTEFTFEILDGLIEAVSEVESFDNQHDGTKGYEKRYKHNGCELRAEATDEYSEVTWIEITKL